MRSGIVQLVRNGLAVWVVVVLLVVAMTIADPGRVWATANVSAILSSMVVLGLVSLGQHLVVLTGGIDLSVGSLASLGAVGSAILIDGYPIRTVPVVGAVLLAGALIGCLHGWLVGRVGLAPFVVTLGTFYMLQGLAFTITTVPAGQMTSAMTEVALNRVGPIPWSFLVLLGAAGFVWVLLSRTAVGRHIFAVGGDVDAAYAVGVPVKKTLLVAYAAGGVLAALAGVVLASQSTVGSPTAGTGLELAAITVVVIGGTSLRGGRGRLIGTVGGVLLLSVIESSFTIFQLPATLNNLIRGLVILIAAALFVARRPRR